MSLRAFHFVFITLSMLLAFGFAWWSFGNYQVQKDTTNLVLAAAGAVVGVALIAYEVWFYKKTKRIIL